MYNLAVSGKGNTLGKIKELFGEKYDLTDDLSQANVLAISESESAEIPDSKLLFSVCDITGQGLSDEMIRYCLDSGICIFNNQADPADSADQSNPANHVNPSVSADLAALTVARVCDFIENGNIKGSSYFPDIDLGPFGDDLCRIIIMMKGIDDPILLAAMMFSGLDVRAVAGGLYLYQNPACRCSETSPADTADPENDTNRNSDTDTADPENDTNKNSDADTADPDNDANKNSGSDSAAAEELYGCALVALREPVTRIPHVDGVLKVRVLQDI